MPFCVLERRARMGSWVGTGAVKAAERQGAQVAAAMSLALDPAVRLRGVDCGPVRRASLVVDLDVDLVERSWRLSR